MTSFHVAASFVVVVHEFRNDVIQVPFTKRYESEKTTGRTLVLTPSAFSVAVKSLLNFVSRSCITIDGFLPWLVV